MAFLSNYPIDLDRLATRRWWKDVAVGEPDECWPWLLSVGNHGYGNTYDGKRRLAHRVAWAMHHQQQIPDGMTIDHICRNRVCCNPNHLRLLPNVVNATDNGQGRKTHCPRGHEYTEENTRMNAKGHRFCRACQKIRNDARGTR